MEIQKVIENLKKNNMEALYFEKSADAVEYLKANMKKGATVTMGGTVSVIESGVLDLVKGGDYNYLKRNGKDMTEEDKLNVFKACVGADYYFCSANAITENGELVNVDGMSNRVSSIAFGPKKVFVIAGTNKIVRDVREGFIRVKTVAAPENAKRLGCNTPCAKTGKCIALSRSDNPEMTDGCDSPDRICRNYLVSAKQKVKDRITVLLINEKLGF